MTAPETADNQDVDEGASSSKPMTAARHAELLAQLTSFVDSPAVDNGDTYEVGYITEDSDDGSDNDEEMGGEMEGIDLEGLRALMEQKRVEEMRVEAGGEPTATIEPIDESAAESDSESDDSSDDSSSDSDSSESSALPARLAQVDMLSDADVDDDESGPAPSGPLKTEHEILEEPVGVPPFEKLAQGARVILAGVVVSVVKDPRVAAWEEWKKAEEVKEEMGAGKEEAEGKAEQTPVEEENVVKVEEVLVKAEETLVVTAEVKPEDGMDSVKQEDGEIEDDQAEVQVTVEVQIATEGDDKPSAAATDAVPQPPTTTDAVEISETKPEIKPETHAEPAAGTAAAKRARNRNRGNRRNVTGKPQGPPAPKTSGTIVVQAQRPPAGTVKGGTDRLDEDGWLLDGSVIVTEEGHALAVVRLCKSIHDSS